MQRQCIFSQGFETMSHFSCVHFERTAVIPPRIVKGNKCTVCGGVSEYEVTQIDFKGKV